MLVSSSIELTGRTPRTFVCTQRPGGSSRSGTVLVNGQEREIPVIAKNERRAVERVRLTWSWWTEACPWGRPPSVWSCACRSPCRSRCSASAGSPCRPCPWTPCGWSWPDPISRTLPPLCSQFRIRQIKARTFAIGLLRIEMQLELMLHWT